MHMEHVGRAQGLPSSISGPADPGATVCYVTLFCEKELIVIGPETEEEQREQAAVPLDPVHATTVHLAMHNADLVIVFGRVSPFFGPSGLVNQAAFSAVACVSLSTVAAKQLVRGLEKTLEDFEKATGVKVPEFGRFADSDTE